MAHQPHVRAGDADRERVAEVLRAAFADGRLTREELDERLSAAYDARTMGQLAELTVDLPAADPYQLPVPVRPGPPPAARPAHRTWPAAAGSWLTASLVVWTIWLIVLAGGGGDQAFWPVWVSGPWGAAVLGRYLSDRLGR